MAISVWVVVRPGFDYNDDYYHSTETETFSAPLGAFLSEEKAKARAQQLDNECRGKDWFKDLVAQELGAEGAYSFEYYESRVEHPERLANFREALANTPIHEVKRLTIEE